ncbi:DNA topoisomerase [Yamadazyma tenuis]|uniref:DNA topoisomerase n=1 Tax=Candida tenuis (strain ATCC 10573 / BCRC 21748 / CBS 615 / JCM 9827 / NBRC 10315 / NRRL Y-1498 / VKM Y-70) TaxID=590646 RepID=G3B9F7_CANTC|nr:uncharacterized protein CANTEDRAFT_108430 [Yamadazyma tenuis ATCC 10573]EGV61874.1 hypothetical protein CANTEDRAFT_108430 [Yamadazyma tenuis ATCC 10573]WEJ93105.1 DNA topoisomerase [Yamadazyma tenuis]
MKVLCVAEKPSIAKEVTSVLSGGRSTRRDSRSKYNANFDFKFTFPGHGLCDVTMTSVTGHITSMDFPAEYAWGRVPPGRLLDAPVKIQPDKSKLAIHQNIANEARSANYLMIWTDCDREGEAIGYEILEAAKKGNTRLSLSSVWRPHFSHLEKNHILSAARNPQNLNMKTVEAVHCRQEVDLRVGASFTRLLTDILRRSKLVDEIVSYGTCQFPTLGFVVDRYKRVKNFVPEKFWYISTSVEKSNQTVSFSWAKTHFFDRLFVVMLYEECMKSTHGTIKGVTRKPTSNFKPFPLTTVSLQKDCATYFKMSAKEALDAAEKLYQSGWISYPRTETDMFPPEMDLRSIIQTHTQDSRWGHYATSLMTVDGKYGIPRKGRNNDKSHPPIHPVKYVNLETITNDKQRKVYEYVVRRFLACCSTDAKGFQTVAELQWGNETFRASGLEVTEKNYLDVYTYRTWSSTEQLPPFVAGERVNLKSAEVKEGKTSPPNHMTETELIALMDANGIGTDATIAEHIHKIEQRSYITKKKTGKSHIILPTELGMGLIEAFSSISFANNISLSKPFLRKRLESLLKEIEEGRATKEFSLRETISLYKNAFALTAEEQSVLVNEFKKFQT